MPMDPSWVATLIPRSDATGSALMSLLNPSSTNPQESHIFNNFARILHSELLYPNELTGYRDFQQLLLNNGARIDNLKEDVIFPASRDFGIEKLRQSKNIAKFEKESGVDVILQEESYRKHKKLIVFDMDSTLIQQEVIDEIADFVGVKAEVAAITERAMNGELDFSASLRARAALLEGVPSTVFESLKSTITFTPGARELCKCLKKLGCKLAVLSGGFMPLAEWVKQELRLDYAYANNLELSQDGKTLSGNLYGDIVNAERKAHLLAEIAEKENIDLKQVVAIGDGANDLLMMKKAGFGIAFNAKPKVQLEAPAKLNTPTLLDVLYIFGYNEKEQRKLLR